MADEESLDFFLTWGDGLPGTEATFGSGYPGGGSTLSPGAGSRFESYPVTGLSQPRITRPSNSEVEPEITDATGTVITPQRLHAEVVEGLFVLGGDYQVHTTGPCQPTTISGGWTLDDNAKTEDAQYALTSGSSQAELIASGFAFDVPEDAIILGVKVRVKRNRV